ncbi:MAG: 6-phosphogluconolactonase [Gammaproteobacteria bacterium]
MTGQQLRWQCFSTSGQLVETLFDDISDVAARSIAERGSFHIVLAGGTTPRLIYQQLRQLETDWSRWHIWFGDERCLPDGDPERNDTMARLAWLDCVPVPPGQVHAIPAEKGAGAAAAAYSMELAGQDDFDLVLLGLGEDGHTASLFPGGELGTDPASPSVLPVHDAPKPPPDRVSMSASRLSRSRHVWFIVTGESKSLALQQWRRGVPVPAAVITPAQAVAVYTDCCDDFT